MTGSCPVPHGPASGTGDRRSTRVGEPARPDVEHVDGVWHIRSERLVREVLRPAEATRQAGFGAEADALVGSLEDGRIQTSPTSPCTSPPGSPLAWSA